MLGIFLLTRTDHIDYDEHDSIVVRAANPSAARALAAESTRGGDFTDAKRSTCTRVGNFTGPQRTAAVILASFNAG